MSAIMDDLDCSEAGSVESLADDGVVESLGVVGIAKARARAKPNITTTTKGKVAGKRARKAKRKAKADTITPPTHGSGSLRESGCKGPAPSSPGGSDAGSVHSLIEGTVGVGPPLVKGDAKPAAVANRAAPGSPVVSDAGSVHSLVEEAGAGAGCLGPSKTRKAKATKAKAKGKVAGSSAQAVQTNVQTNADAKAGKEKECFSDIPPSVWEDARKRGEQIARWMGGLCCVLEIYAGCARFSGAVAEQGMNLFVPMDTSKGRNPWADTDNVAVQAVVLVAIELGLIWYVHLAPECRLWSRARARGKAPLATGTLWFTAAVLDKIHAFNALGAAANPWQPRRIDMIYVSIENPWPSDLFSVKRIAVLVQKLGLQCIRYECCAWGATYMKPSQLKTNLRELTVLGERRCKDMEPHTHDTLEGKVDIMDGGQLVSVWKTSLASKYVPALCRAWAKVLRQHAPKGALVEANGSALNPQWQIWLMESSGFTNFPLVCVPLCPEHFSSGWEDAQGKWTHFDAPGQMKETRRKRLQAMKRRSASIVTRAKGRAMKKR